MNFDDFLTQLKKPSNYILTRYFKSFMTEFNKKEWKRAQHHRIITDFLRFISDKTLLAFQQQQHLHQQHQLNTNKGAFITPSSPTSLLMDIERHWKHLVQQKLYDKLFGLPEEKELDSHLQSKCNTLAKFLELSHFTSQPFSLSISIVHVISSEFEKMNSQKTTADKLVHIVNGCKILLSFLSQTAAETADLIQFDEDHNTPTKTTITIDEYLPVLIFILVKKYPTELYLNCSYIEALEPDLTGESAYYFTNVMSTLQYIQNLDKTRLNLDPAWFDLQLGIQTTLPTSPIHTSPTHAPIDSSSRSISLNNVIGFFSKYVPSSTSSSSSTFLTSATAQPVHSRPLSSLITPADTPSPTTYSGTREVPSTTVAGVAGILPKSVSDEEEFQLQLALALSLSEQESARELGEEEVGWQDFQ